MMRFDTELPQDFQDCIEKWRGYSKSHGTDQEEE
jgi:23S rRNA pseudouridine1911/1915/1917 synthase